MRVILHVDMDAYFASVEQVCNPSLMGKAVAVTGAGKRTVITTSSYEARRYGVKTGMPVHAGKKVCPQLITIVGDHRKYASISAGIMAICGDYTPQMEPSSIDEAFLDITGSISLFGGIEAIVRDIKRRIYSEFGLTCSIGVAPNKLMAKLASGMCKPDGLMIVRPEELHAMLEDLPVGKLSGIGGKMAGNLEELGISTCGELSRFPVGRLTARFGIVGERLHEMALGIDASPVVGVSEAKDPKSIGHSKTMDSDIRTRPELCRQILLLSEMVGRRARRYGFAGRTVTLTIRYSDFHTFSRRHSIKSYINQGLDISKVANTILENIRLKMAVRLVGVTLSGLRKAPLQAELFGNKVKRAEAVKAMDRINDRYGEFSIAYASIMSGPRH